MKLFEHDIGALLMRVWQAAQPTTPDISISVPAGSPWWAGIVIGGAALIYWLVRKYVDRKQEREGARFAVELEKIRSQISETQSDTRKTEVLATSINAMAEAVTTAYSGLAEDRRAAIAERKEFRMNLDTNTEEIRKLREQVKTSAQQDMEHTTEQVDLLRKDVAKLQIAADQAVEGINKAVTAEQLIEALKPLQVQLDNISQNAGDLLRQKPASISVNGDNPTSPVSETPSTS